MYGSYPEITVTARYFKPLIKRFLYFNATAPPLKKFTAEKILDIATHIFEKNREQREIADTAFETFVNYPDPGQRNSLCQTLNN
jgi:hypothetical protein